MSSINVPIVSENSSVKFETPPLSAAGLPAAAKAAPDVPFTESVA